MPLFKPLLKLLGSCLRLFPLLVKFLPYTFLLSLCMLMLPSAYANELSQQDQIKKSVGQIVILDFRFYCDDGTSSKACKNPVTTLPDALKDLLVTHNIGGVILFSENIKTNKQLIELNYAMQSHGKSEVASAVYCSRPRRGRTSRLTFSMVKAFAGNLAKRAK